MKTHRIAACFLFGLCRVWSAATEEKTDPFMGDWQGKLRLAQGGTTNIVAQVIPQGGDSYLVNVLPRFDARVPALAVLEGKVTNETLVLGQNNPAGSPAAAWGGVIAQGRFTGNSAEGGDNTFSMKKIVRLSPALGARPPKGAIVLLGRKTKDLSSDWQRDNGAACGWTLLPDGVMRVVPDAGSIVSRREFKNHRIHLEFRIPCEPDKRGQGRGNSGVYVQGRYEVQILDSYGLEGRKNECGGIYEVYEPLVNMAAPPLQWQSYDITFTAMVMDGDTVIKLPRITVVHNGVKIHDNMELPHITGGSPFKNAMVQAGPLFLQDHQHPVEYRNIWIEELP